MDNNIMEKYSKQLYDKHTIYVKTNKAQEISEKYKCFGWNLSDQVANRKYEDLVDLTFTRPHKVSNKDELQLLQVYMEERFNNLARSERNKNAKSTIFGLCYGMIALIIAILGTLICLEIIPFYRFAVGIPLIVFAFAMFISEGIVLPRIVKSENNEFKLEHSRLENELQQICSKAQKLLNGDNYEQK